MNVIRNSDIICELTTGLSNENEIEDDPSSELLVLGKIKVCSCKMVIFISCMVHFIAGSLELAYSLIWGSHKIWGKGGGDTLDLL